MEDKRKNAVLEILNYWKITEFLGQTDIPQESSENKKLIKNIKNGKEVKAEKIEVFFDLPVLSASDIQIKKLQTKKPQKNIKRKLKNKITSFIKFSCFLEVIQLIACMILFFCLKFGINPLLFNWDIMGKASYVVAVISCLVAIYGAVKGIANVRRVKRKSGVMGLFIAFATILSVVVVLIKPVMDKYYYGCVLLVCAATILTLIDLVISHNRMSTRPLPQFEYKGGDHRA